MLKGSLSKNVTAYFKQNHFEKKFGLNFVLLIQNVFSFNDFYRYYLLSCLRKYIDATR